MCSALFLLWPVGLGARCGRVPQRFLILSAGYLHMLISSSFGTLLFLVRRRSEKLLAICFIISVMAVLLIRRIAEPATCGIFTRFCELYAFSCQKIVVKCIVGLFLFLGIDFWFHLGINFRDVGFETYFSGESNQRLLKMKHVGLGMMSELCFINTFYDNRCGDGIWNMDCNSCSTLGAALFGSSPHPVPSGSRPDL